MMTLFSDDQLAITYDAEKEREFIARAEREKETALKENNKQLAYELLLTSKIPIEDIARLTKLSVDDVKALNKN